MADCGPSEPDRLGLRVGALFVILATSLVGTLFPIVSKRVPFLRRVIPAVMFEFAKYAPRYHDPVARHLSQDHSQVFRLRSHSRHRPQFVTSVLPLGKKLTALPQFTSSSQQQTKSVPATPSPPVAASLIPGPATLTPCASLLHLHHLSLTSTDLVWDLPRLPLCDVRPPTRRLPHGNRSSRQIGDLGRVS